MIGGWSLFWVVYWTAMFFFLIGYVVNALLAANRRAGDAGFDLIRHLHRQRTWSLSTFGPGQRTAGVIDHLRKEIAEIEAAPTDVSEWVDVVLLALDGAWRAGHDPEYIARALHAKQLCNESRAWPDWRMAEPGKAIEHVKREVAHG